MLHYERTILQRKLARKIKSIIKIIRDIVTHTLENSWKEDLSFKLEQNVWFLLYCIECDVQHVELIISIFSQTRWIYFFFAKRFFRRRIIIFHFWSDSLNTENEKGKKCKIKTIWLWVFHSIALQVIQWLWLSIVYCSIGRSHF